METIRNKKNKEIAREICGDDLHGEIGLLSGDPNYGNEIMLRLVERQGYLEDMRELRIAIEIGPNTQITEIRKILSTVKDTQAKLDKLAPVMTDDEMIISLFQELLNGPEGKSPTYTDLANLYNSLIKYKKRNNWYPELSLADMLSGLGLSQEKMDEINKLPIEDISDNYPIDNFQVKDGFRYRRKKNRPGILTLLRSKEKGGKA